MAGAVAPYPIDRDPPPEAFDDGQSIACDGQNDGRHVTLEQYLNTDYTPDCDFVDGRLEERNLGEFDHATLQGEIFFLLRSRASDWSIRVIPELRLQVGPNRFRVPDIMVLRSDHQVDRFVREAPLLCIEILSPEDRFDRLRIKVRDYLALGVQHIWAFDPETSEAFLCDSNGFHKVLAPDLTVPGTPIWLALTEVFSQRSNLAS